MIQTDNVSSFALIAINLLRFRYTVGGFVVRFEFVPSGCRILDGFLIDPLRVLPFVTILMAPAIKEK